MRILALDLGAEWRGGQIQTLLSAHALVRRGHTVLVGALAGAPLARRTGRDLDCATLRAGGEAGPGMLWDLRRTVRRFRPDVLLASDARSHGGSVWSGSFRVAPLVVRRHVVFAPRRDPASRLKYRVARRFLAVSEAVAAALRSAGINPERIAVVPVAIDAVCCAPGGPPPPPPFVLAHAGAFDGRKGQEIVVRVVALLAAEGRDVHAIFLGDGPRRPAVEAEAQSLGVAARCTFAGFVDDVPSRLARCHLLLLPSQGEGAPLVLLEALAAGCPVVVHDPRARSGVTHESGCGAVLGTLDARAWAATVPAWLDDPAARARAAAAGRRWAGGHTVSRLGERLEAELEIVRTAPRDQGTARR